MPNSKPYWGKDGNHYSDIYEMQAANTRYEQREKLIEEQREANRLVREQNERIKNADSSNKFQNYAKKNKRMGPLILLLCLIIGLIMTFSGLAIRNGIYVLALGLFVECISAYRYNKKYKITHFFEITLAMISISFIVLNNIPISMIKQVLPIGSEYYTLEPSHIIITGEHDIKVGRFAINDNKLTYEKKEKLKINETINITAEYKKSNNGSFIGQNQKEITIEFNPKEYFKVAEEHSVLNDLTELYVVYVEDLISERIGK